MAQAGGSAPSSVRNNAAVHDLEKQVRSCAAGRADALGECAVPLRNAGAAPGIAGHAQAAGAYGRLRQTRSPLSEALASVGQPARPPQKRRFLRQGSPGLADRVQKLEESTALLGEKVDEQYQTKVETASKYRARLSGIVLMNAFRNVGASDNLDFPDYAQPTPPGTSQATFGRHACGRRRSDWKYLGPIWRAQRVRPMCASILREGFPQRPTVSILESCACRPRA